MPEEESQIISDAQAVWISQYRPTRLTKGPRFHKGRSQTKAGEIPALHGCERDVPLSRQPQLRGAWKVAHGHRHTLETHRCGQNLMKKSKGINK